MHFSKTSPVRAPADALYRWHMRPGAFERLSPPWDDVRVLERRGDTGEPGSLLVLSVPMGPIRRRWVAEHRDVERGRMFRDVQLEGPFAHWEHTHRFRDNGAGSILEDEIRFELPLGRVGRALFGKSAIHALERLFRYRHDTTTSDVETHQHYRAISPMRLGMTGSSGLVGSSLRSFLTTGGHEVVRLADFEGCDAVVHVADGSGVERTLHLSESLARMAARPRVLLQISSVGFYGERGSELLDESSAPGSGYLASVFSELEQATRPARDAKIRVVHLRTGIVLSPRGGALERLLPFFRVGLGGAVGMGEQFVSWTTTDELASMALHVLATDALEGPVNAVSPTPVRNRELTKALARVLGRPALVPMPRFALRKHELFLSSARVAPRNLLDTGYRFRYPELEAALRHVLGRSNAR